MPLTPSKRELIFPLAIFSALIAIVFILWNNSLNTQKSNYVRELQNTGSLRAKEFFSLVKHNIKSLENLKQRIEMTNGSYFGHWEKDAGLILEQNASFRFVEWLDSSMVIKKVTPLEGNRAAIGINLTKHPRYPEWRNHVLDSTTNISPWTKLYQGGSAFLVDAPVYFDGAFKGSVTAGMDFTVPSNRKKPFGLNQKAAPSISTTAFLPISPQLVPTCSRPNVKGAPMNFIVYKALSVHTNITSFAFMAPMIFVPSCSLKVPAVFIADGAYVFISS